MFCGRPFSRVPVRPDRSTPAPAEESGRVPTARSVGDDAMAEVLARRVVASSSERAAKGTTDPCGGRQPLHAVEHTTIKNCEFASWAHGQRCHGATDDGGAPARE